MQQEMLIRYKEKHFFTMREMKYRTGYPERLEDLPPWRYAKLGQARP